MNSKKALVLKSKFYIVSVRLENFKVRIFLRIFIDLTFEAWFIMLEPTI